MPLYALAYSGHISEAFIVTAQSKAEALGKATEKNYGAKPLGEPKRLKEILDEDGAARLV